MHNIDRRTGDHDNWELELIGWYGDTLIRQKFSANVTLLVYSCSADLQFTMYSDYRRSSAQWIGLCLRCPKQKIVAAIEYGPVFQNPGDSLALNYKITGIPLDKMDDMQWIISTTQRQKLDRTRELLKKWQIPDRSGEGENSCGEP